MKLVLVFVRARIPKFNKLTNLEKIKIFNI